MKHVVERAISKYIANGEFIAAALIAPAGGPRWRHSGDDCGGEREVRHRWRRPTVAPDQDEFPDE